MNAHTRTLGPLAALAIALLIRGAAPALAGEVYGKITHGGASVGDAATVAARCGDKAYPAQPTDKSGTYHIIVGQSGRCTLTVTCKGQSADLAIVSYEDAAQVDIILEMKDGKLAARRK